jgi:hypothetical protein
VPSLLDAVRGGGRPLKRGDLSRRVADKPNRSRPLTAVDCQIAATHRYSTINHANMTLVAILGAESRSMTHRGWKMFLRNSANNMLTRPPCDVPQASFADTNAVGFIARHLRLPEAGLSLLDLIYHGA